MGGGCIKLIESITRKQFIKRVICHSHSEFPFFSINLQLLKVQRKRSKHEILIKIYKKWEWNSRNVHVAINNLAGVDGRKTGYRIRGIGWDGIYMKEVSGHVLYALCTCLRFPEEISIIRNRAKETSQQRRRLNHPDSSRLSGLGHNFQFKLNIYPRMN